MASIRLPKIRLLGRFDPLRMIKRIRILPTRRKWDKIAPLKVAFYTDTYLPNVDGVVNSMLNYKNELEKRGNRVYVFTSGTSSDAKEYGNGRTFFFESVVFPPYPQYKVAIFPFTSYRNTKKSGVNLIHSHAIASMGLAAITSAKVLNLPLVGTFHTMLPKTGFVVTKSSLGKRMFSEVAWQAIKQFYAPFDLVTAPSRTIEKLMNENGIERTAFVPNGIDTSKFSPSIDRHLIRKLLGIKPSEKVILTAGRISDEKNVHVLLRAFEMLQRNTDAKFIVQGDGPAKQKMVKLARKIGLGSKVIFTGFVKGYEVPYFYAAADVFATASTFETQGLALLEAMACGKVCVGAHSLAIPEALKEGYNGFLFKPFNEHECAEKLGKALSLGAAQEKRMGRNARSTALSYSIEKSTDRLMDAYKKVL